MGPRPIFYCQYAPGYRCSFRRGRRPRRPARFTMVFSINRRGVEDAAPYTRPTDTRRTPAPPLGVVPRRGPRPPHGRLGWGFQGKGSTKSPSPEWRFCLLLPPRAKVGRARGRETLLLTSQKSTPSPPKNAKKVLAIWRKIGYNVSVYGKHVRLNLIKARHTPRGTPLRRT